MKKKPIIESSSTADWDESTSEENDQLKAIKDMVARWDEHVSFLEGLEHSGEDAFSLFNRSQAKVLRFCIEELRQVLGR